MCPVDNYKSYSTSSDFLGVVSVILFLYGLTIYAPKSLCDTLNCIEILLQMFETKYVWSCNACQEKLIRCSRRFI